MSDALTILADLHVLGVRARPVGDNLTLRPAALVPAEMIERVRATKPQLLATLREAEARLGRNCADVDHDREASELDGLPAGSLAARVANAFDVERVEIIEARPHFREKVKAALLPIHREEPVQAAAIRDAWAKQIDAGRAAGFSLVHTEWRAYEAVAEAVANWRGRRERAFTVCAR